MLKSRGLSHSGRKQELEERLAEDEARVAAEWTVQAATIAASIHTSEPSAAEAPSSAVTAAAPSAPQQTISTEPFAEQLRQGAAEGGGEPLVTQVSNPAREVTTQTTENSGATAQTDVDADTMRSTTEVFPLKSVTATVCAGLVITTILSGSDLGCAL